MRWNPRPFGKIKDISPNGPLFHRDLSHHRTVGGLTPFGWFAGQDEANARAGLLVDGFREAAEFHLIKDALVPSPSSWPIRRSAQILAMRGLRANLVICDGRARLGRPGNRPDGNPGWWGRP